MIFCQKLKEELEGLSFLPYPGELGQKIFLNISKQAWQDWLKRQTMIINEYRLDMAKPEDRAKLEVEMEKYFFSEESDLPSLER